LLDFARPDGIRLAACDLRSEAEQIAEFVRAEDASASVDIRVEVPEDARWATADPDKIKQVLLNLVQNGVEASDRGGTVRVAATVQQEGVERGVRVAVTDSGKGMSPEQADRILEPFYTDKDGGTGLGLCIVHRILQLHGTSLEVDSTPGQGTTVAFQLPMASTAEER
jgi:signal transduction histidine kinase